ncbi:MAG: DJ-1/PfpI family protein [Ruminococcaceae bacterium]|nr:DJ-1/PfpI family protein [Oscillospiraceae bacterium]
MKVVMLLANGFEESEAIVPADILTRAGAEVILVSVEDSLSVESTHGIKLSAQRLLSDISGDDMDALVLPGGMPGAQTLADSFPVKELVQKAVDKGVYVAAICAAPFVLGQMGLLDGRNIACYPGFEKYMPEANVTGEKVEVDDIFITAQGMGVSLEFGLKIAEMLVGADAAGKIAEQIRKA